MLIGIFPTHLLTDFKDEHLLQRIKSRIEAAGRRAISAVNISFSRKREVDKFLNMLKLQKLTWSWNWPIRVKLKMILHLFACHHFLVYRMTQRVRMNIWAGGAERYLNRDERRVIEEISGFSYFRAFTTQCPRFYHYANPIWVLFSFPYHSTYPLCVFRLSYPSWMWLVMVRVPMTLSPSSRHFYKHLKSINAILHRQWSSSTYYNNADARGCGEI